MTRRIRTAWTVALLGGAVLWLAAAGISGKREAWDASLYWTVAWPLSIALAGGLGHFVPERPWRWGLAVMLPQALLLMMSGAGIGLLPLGLLVFSILALPAIGAAALMAHLRRRGASSR